VKSQILTFENPGSGNFGKKSSRTRAIKNGPIETEIFILHRSVETGYPYYSFILIVHNVTSFYHERLTMFPLNLSNNSDYHLKIDFGKKVSP
jgi:hypothetical protein